MLLPIQSEQEFRLKLKHLDSVLTGNPEIKDDPEVERLLTQIQAWENPYLPSPPDPIEMIKFAMESRGWTAANLAPAMEGDLASDVLKKKRPLTLGMIRWLHANLGISLECLIQEYRLTR